MLILENVWVRRATLCDMYRFGCSSRNKLSGEMVCFLSRFLFLLQLRC